MPSRGIALNAVAALLALGACAAPALPYLVPQSQSSVITHADAAAAVRPLLASAPVCMAWPALWIEEDQRREIVVRYDLMRRDWGASVTDARERRMDEFVVMGFLTKRAAPELGAGAAVYTLTEEGRRYFRTAEEETSPPRFCAPAERRLVSVTTLTPGDFSCGSVRVRFTHIADTAPTWVRTSSARARWEASGPPVGQVGYGAVSLGRRGGALQSLCEPADLDLVAPP